MRSVTFLVSALLLASAPLIFAQEGGAPAAPPAEVPAGPVVQNFTLNASKTKIYAVTRKGGVAAALAHDHVIVATQVSGAISFSEQDASKSSINVKIDVPSMDVDSAAMRQKAGLPPGPSDDDRKSVKENMLAENQLNGSKFPTMTFQSTKITAAGGKYTVEGNLTIRGVTQKVSFPATVAMEGGAFHGSGSLKITHTQFGFEPYSAAFGAIGNQNDITLVLDIWGDAK